MHKFRGFNLVQLMIVVAIIGILVSIAYPSYTRYKIRAERTNAQSELLFIGQRMQAYQAANRTYAGATVTTVYGVTVTPKQGTALYDLAFNPATTVATGWTLIATPKSNTTQAGDGVICLNDQGQRFWSKAATACSLSASSTWDN